MWIEMAAFLLGVGTFVVFMTWHANSKAAWLRSQQDPCDYVVFEAYPSHLPGLEADLADHRWRLASSEPFRDGAELYRFEKIDSHSALLSEVLNFRKSMPRTSNRKADAHGPIKIKAQGLRSERHG